ncbi:unnamed protein product, partial [Meganyctiphanes norvegica]
MLVGVVEIWFSFHQDSLVRVSLECVLGPALHPSVYTWSLVLLSILVFTRCLGPSATLCSVLMLQGDFTLHVYTVPWPFSGPLLRPNVTSGPALHPSVYTCFHGGLTLSGPALHPGVYTCLHGDLALQRPCAPSSDCTVALPYGGSALRSFLSDTIGLCPTPFCPYLHRTAGDTERRYHLRYYKTGMCVHDTDSRGMCVKNGPHCAFAHGVDDVRPPVYDIRELQALEIIEQDAINGSGPNNLDKERNMVNDDPKWQDTSYVLANYKTEQCKRPPRLCRQGYACPQYHNSRDRRRSPKKFKYSLSLSPKIKGRDQEGGGSNCKDGVACKCKGRSKHSFGTPEFRSPRCNVFSRNGHDSKNAYSGFQQPNAETRSIRCLLSAMRASTKLSRDKKKPHRPDRPQTCVNLSVNFSQIGPKTLQVNPIRDEDSFRLQELSAMQCKKRYGGTCIISTPLLLRRETGLFGGITM